MSVEFMSNVRYALFVSQRAWRDWTQELRAHLSTLFAESTNGLLDTQGAFVSRSPSISEEQEPQDDEMSQRTTSSPNIISRSVDTSEMAGRTLAPGSACTISNSPIMVNSQGPLSPSGFFSPVVHSWWPSFLSQRSVLDESDLTNEQAELHGNEIPQEELQWTGVAERDIKVHQGPIPLTDEYLDALDPSIVW